MKFLTPARARIIDPTAIVHLVEDAYGYPHGTLQRRTNASHIAHPRHLVTFLLLETGLSLPRVGTLLRRHHTTVMHSRDTVLRAIEEDETVKALIDDLRAAIQAESEKFTKPKPRVKSVIKLKPERRTKPLPNIAHGQFRGVEELDALIVSGRGDQPRISVEDLTRKGVRNA